jgi:hypothetical protein
MVLAFFKFMKVPKFRINIKRIRKMTHDLCKFVREVFRKYFGSLGNEDWLWYNSIMNLKKTLLF